MKNVIVIHITGAWQHDQMYGHGKKARLFHIALMLLTKFYFRFSRMGPAMRACGSTVCIVYIDIV